MGDQIVDTECLIMNMSVQVGVPICLLMFMLDVDYVNCMRLCICIDWCRSG